MKTLKVYKASINYEKLDYAAYPSGKLMYQLIYADDLVMS